MELRNCKVMLVADKGDEGASKLPKFKFVIKPSTSDRKTLFMYAEKVSQCPLMVAMEIIC